MRAAPVSVLLILLILLTLGRAGPSMPQVRQQGGVSLYAHAFLDPERRPSVIVSVNVPYTSLIFLKKRGVFQSEHVVYVKILDEKKRLVDTAVITETVAVADYEATRSAKMISRTSRRFRLEPGDYVVSCAVEVKNTQRVFERETALTVPEFLEAGIGVGKPRLFAAEIDTSMSSPVLVEARAYHGLRSEEQEDATFTALSEHPALVFDVYTEEENSDTVDCALYFEVVDENRVVYAYGRRCVGIAGLQSQFVVYLDVDEWESGSYTFHAKAVQLGPPRETTSSLRFTLGYTRAMLTKYLDRTIAVLSLIATDEEMEEFKNAPENERFRVWASFWARRDPSPGTDENEALEEHLRRVRYAIDHYSEATPGWQTDRGRVYIKYGEPDHTEMRMDPQYQGEYLIWYYYEGNFRFVFYDRFGLGEYRLTDTSQL